MDEVALIAALDAGQVRGYVTDFPNAVTYQHDKVIVLPHLGASTSSAEDNCAVMIADELQDFLENGNIRFSVNFPAVSLPRRGFTRLTLAHRNAPGVIAQFSQVVGGAGINIVELINDCRGDYAYSIMELDSRDLPAAGRRATGADAGTASASDPGRAFLTEHFLAGSCPISQASVS